MASLDVAWQQYSSGHFDDAIDECKDYLSGEPDDSWAYVILAYCYADQNKKNRATEAIDTALGLAPNDEDVHVGRAYVMIKLGQNSQALVSCRAALEIDPENVQARSYMAIALTDLGKRREAMAAVDRALELEPESAVMHNLRAELFRVAKDKEAALAASSEALRLNPENPDFHATRSRILRSKAGSKESIQAMKESMRLDPTDQDNRDELLEAFRARFPLYRWMYSFSEWSAGLEGHWRYAPIVALYLVGRVGARLLPKDSPWKWVLLPFGILYGLLMFTIYLMPILLDAWMSLDKQVKNFLSRDHRRGVIAVTSCFLIGLALLALSAVDNRFFAPGIAELLLGFLLGGMLSHLQSFGGRYRVMFGWSIFIHVASLGGLIASLVG